MNEDFPQPTYAPLTIAEVYAVLERHKQRLVCAPDVYERAQAAVREAQLESVYQVLENRWLEDGQVVLMASEAEFDGAFPYAGASQWSGGHPPSAPQHFG